MDWDNLLKPYRLGCPKESPTTETADRTDFQRDFDRIIFFAAFRRLQSKTQVFPFPETDVIHTRLTHSLESASVGRSLGTIIGKKIDDENISGGDLGAIVCAACLAHDIGNPPFGHSGEDAIKEYFSSPNGEKVLAGLEDEQRRDFTQFDGNAMGFHLLTYSNPKVTQTQGGLGLTYPTLAAFTKYPRSAAGEIVKEGDISEKKPGIFSCCVNDYEEIANELGIEKKNNKENYWHRHPLAFLTEAADDICYNIIDLEDGFKHGLVSYEEAAEYLKNIAEVYPGQRGLSDLENIIDERNKIGYLRAKAINSLIYQVVDVFDNNEADIMTGNHTKSLCSQVKSQKDLENISVLSIEKIYKHRPVLQIEAAGFQVIPGLLDTFFSALLNPKKSSSKKIKDLIPKDYLFDFEKEKYESIMNITAYVAGMTDNFALETYRNLKGIQLPNC